MGWEVDLPDVVPGEFIEDAWGNEIRDKVVHIATTFASLPTDVPDGGIAYANDTDNLYLRRSGAWVQLPYGQKVLDLAGTVTHVASSAVSTSVGLPSVTPGAVATVTLTMPWTPWRVVGNWAFVAQATAAGANQINTIITLDGTNIGTQWNSFGIAESASGALSTTTLGGVFNVAGTTTAAVTFDVRASIATAATAVNGLRRQLVITAYYTGAP